MVWFFTSNADATLRAARERDLAQLKRLHKLKKLRVDTTDPKRGNKSPLHFAVLSRNAEIVSQILKATHVKLTIQDNFGNSPLHLACEQGSAGIAEMLLNQHVRLVQDPAAQLRLVNHLRRTALHVCAYEGHSEIAYELISKGAQLEVRDRDGCTALHLACARGHKSVAEVLLQADANANALDSHKQTPLVAAKAHGFSSAVEEAFQTAASVEPCSPSTTEGMTHWNTTRKWTTADNVVRTFFRVTLVAGLFACAREIFLIRDLISETFSASDIMAAFKQAGHDMLLLSSSSSTTNTTTSDGNTIYKCLDGMRTAFVSFVQIARTFSDVLRIAGYVVLTSIIGLVILRMVLEGRKSRKKTKVPREGDRSSPGPRTPRKKGDRRKRTLQVLTDSPSVPAPAMFELTRNQEIAPHGKVFTRAHARKGKLDETDVWSEPEASSFILRGKTYISDGGIKVPSAPAVFSAADMCVMEPSLKNSPGKLPELIEFLRSGGGKDDEWLFVSWHVPVQPVAAVVYAFKRTIPAGTDLVFDKLWERFRKGGDDFRNSRFKFIPSVKQGPKAVEWAYNALGGVRPVLIGKKLKTAYYFGDNYTSIEIDVGSNWIASKLAGHIFPDSTEDVVVDLSFCIQGNEESELPERLLGTIRNGRMNLRNMVFQPFPDDQGPS